MITGVESAVGGGALFERPCEGLAERRLVAGQQPMVDRHPAAPGFKLSLLHHLKRIICLDAERYHLGKGRRCRAFKPLPRWLHPCSMPSSRASSRRASAAPPSRITASWFHWKTGRNNGANAFIHARFVCTHQS